MLSPSFALILPNSWLLSTTLYKREEDDAEKLKHNKDTYKIKRTAYINMLQQSKNPTTTSPGCNTNVVYLSTGPKQYQLIM